MNITTRLHIGLVIMANRGNGLSATARFIYLVVTISLCIEVLFIV